MFRVKNKTVAPDRCAECDLIDVNFEKKVWYCTQSALKKDLCKCGEDVTAVEAPDWCPLTPVPYEED
jgi:hypothetical protein